MSADHRRVQLLAGALGLPQLAVRHRAGAGRWRDARAGRLGSAAELVLDEGQSARQRRLALLRQVADARPEGRHALRVLRGGAPGLIGPLAPVGAVGLGLAHVFQSWPHPRLLARWFCEADGARVDRWLFEAFPGAAADLALDPPAREGTGPVASDAREVLQQVIARYRALLDGRPLRRKLQLPAIPVQDEPEWPLHDRPSARGSPGGPDPSAQVVDEPAAPGASHSSAGADPVDRTESQPASRAGRSVATQPDPVPPPQRAARPILGTGSVLWPEWDFRARAYRPRWVTVHERRVQPETPTDEPPASEAYRAAWRRLRGRLGLAAPHSPRRQRAQPDGAIVDLEAALDYQIDRRTGRGGRDDRLYEAEPHRARDLSVALLIDCSASTRVVLPDPAGTTDAPDGTADTAADDQPLWQPPRAPRTPVRHRRTVLDAFKDTARLLCEALAMQGDRSGVFAFSGDGRHRMDLGLVKAFEDPWSPRALASLHALHPRGATRTGAAVRAAAAHLRRDGARRQLLIVISDGYPQDSDYGRDAQDLDYGLHDTARALREVEAGGIGALNVSVDAGAHDYLRRLCPRHRYLAIRDVDALPQAVFAWWRRHVRGLG